MENESLGLMIVGVIYPQTTEVNFTLVLCWCNGIDHCNVQAHLYLYCITFVLYVLCYRFVRKLRRTFYINVNKL